MPYLRDEYQFTMLSSQVTLADNFALVVCCWTISVVRMGRLLSLCTRIRSRWFSAVYFHDLSWTVARVCLLLCPIQGNRQDLYVLVACPEEHVRFLCFGWPVL